MKKIYLLFWILISTGVASQNISFDETATLWVYGSHDKDTLPEEQYTAGTFNFNPVIQFPNDENVFKNLLNEYFSLFVVFKSETEEEKTVLTIRSRKNETRVTNKKVDLDTEIPFEKSDAGQGAILSYLARVEGYSKRNSLAFDDFSELMENEGDNHQLMEIILFPRLLTKLEREKTESYLSVKYGISLIGERDYINSSKDTIWHYNKSEPFNNRVTGIGRDDTLGLYQKQSGNAEKDGLYIGLQSIEPANHKNSSEILNDVYLLWGDNAGLTLLESDVDDPQAIKKMDRVWKTLKTSKKGNDSLETQLAINKLEMVLSNDPEGPKEDAKLWLAVSKGFNKEFNYREATYIKQSVGNDSIVLFDKVYWNAGSQYFTIVGAPDFFVLHEPETNCNDGDLTYYTYVDIHGGEAPYGIQAVSENGVFEFSTDSDRYRFSLDPGTYELIVTDANSKIYTDWMTLENKPGFSVELNDTWLLDENGTVDIIPVVQNVDENSGAFEFEWKFNEEVIAVGAKLTANNPGDYELSVISPLGCEINIPFKVEGNISMLSHMTLLPNPVHPFEEFTIAFNMEAQTDVHIRIFNMNGQLVKQDKLKDISSGTYHNHLTTSGSYLITIETVKGTQTFKIIVK